MIRPSTSSSNNNGDGGAKFPLTFTTGSSTTRPSNVSAIGNETTALNSNIGDGIINPVFVDSLVQINKDDPDEVKFPSPPPIEIRPQRKPETVDRTDSASNLSSSGSTVITNASSTGGLLPNNNNNHSGQFLNAQCPECHQFHQNKHRVFVHKRPVYLPTSTNPYTTSTAYAPYPPQWYYLLAADTKKFRKHRHTHYRRDCRQCREIVRATFEQYYLRSGQFYLTPATTILSQQQMAPVHSSRVRQSSNGINTLDGEETSDSIGSISLDHHNQHNQQRTPSASYSPSTFFSTHPHPPASPSFFTNAVYASSESPLPFYKSRASCGHSCLKFTILFYCCIAVIMSICFICYLTRMFGFMSDSHMPVMSFGDFNNYYSPINSNYSIIEGDSNFTGHDPLIDSTIMMNTSMFDLVDTGHLEQADSELPATSLMETIRTEIIGLLVASAFMIIFILGLIGAFLESVLCLRIFGAILSYLFLLTFGSALYVVILLIISHIPLKLILSTISCAVVAITIHGLLAIAPFAFADLISEERNDELTEAAAANSTYFKYPSVRFIPPPQPKRNGRSGYFGFGGGIHRWTSRPNIVYTTGVSGGTGITVPPTPLLPPLTTTTTNTTNHSQQTIYRDTPIESIPTSDESIRRNTPPTIINLNHHNNQGPMDNLSSEGLIPPAITNENIKRNGKSTSGSGQTVRFTDNWM